MNRAMRNIISRRGRLPRGQKGALTMFTAVLILILLTEMVIYAVQVGVFEQRKSANEMRQKEAFHIADSAIQFGKEFMLANANDVVSTGTGGWLNASSLRWKKCSDAGLTAAYGSHPCYGEPADNSTDFTADLRSNMYYYFPDATGDRGTPDADGNPTLPISSTITSALTDNTQRVDVYALLCMLNIDRNASPIIQGCTTTPAADPDNPGVGEQDERYFLITLMARGEADCVGAACTATQLVSQKIGSFGPGGGEGGPGVPLTTRSNFPPTGSAEIVPNPNGGGVGVPISSWMNANSNCPNQTVVAAENGSWATCERHEWYGVDRMPADYKCPTANCSCDSSEKRISYSQGQDDQLGIDLVEDPNFPCDLFEYLFGVPKYEADGVTINSDSVDFVKYGVAQEVLTDCSGLDQNSKGVYWVSGNTCQVNANVQVGSADDPVILISAAGTTRFNGGASLFGILMVTDVEVSTAKFNAVGTMTIYGAAVIDATLDQYQGTFQIVYQENIIDSALASGGFGDVTGGWSDFHLDWR